MKHPIFTALLLSAAPNLVANDFFGSYPYTVPPLPYAYDALEPHIDAETMRIHHDKHHQAYVDGLNGALAKSTKYQKKNLPELLEEWDDLPKDIRTAVRNHGGGHYNHSLFWLCMAPNARVEPEGALKEALIKQWGSFAQFTEAFSAAAKTVFGSGWAWLVADDKGKLSIVTTQNQDTPLDDDDIIPLLCLDVWEHAYYLKHQNKRGDYISAWWNVINWPFAEERYKKALKK